MDLYPIKGSFTVKVTYDDSKQLSEKEIPFAFKQWYTWADLRKQHEESKKGEYSKGDYEIEIPSKAGVYGIGAKWKLPGHIDWLYIGSTGSGAQKLDGRMHRFTRGEEKDKHTAVVKILKYWLKDHNITYDPKELKGVENLKDFTKNWEKVFEDVVLSWSESEDFILLEYFLHLRFNPKYPDRRLFPKG